MPYLLHPSAPDTLTPYCCRQARHVPTMDPLVCSNIAYLGVSLTCSRAGPPLLIKATDTYDTIYNYISDYLINISLTMGR